MFYKTWSLTDRPTTYRALLGCLSVRRFITLRLFNVYPLRAFAYFLSATAVILNLILPSMALPQCKLELWPIDACRTDITGASH